MTDEWGKIPKVDTMKCPECNQETHRPDCPRRFKEHPEDIPTAEELRERQFAKDARDEPRTR